MTDLARFEEICDYVEEHLGLDLEKAIHECGFDLTPRQIEMLQNDDDFDHLP